MEDEYLWNENGQSPEERRRYDSDRTENGPAGRHARRKRYRKKETGLLSAIRQGAVFGLAAAVVFLGVNYAAG